MVRVQSQDDPQAAPEEQGTVKFAVSMNWMSPFTLTAREVVESGVWLASSARHCSVTVLTRASTLTSDPRCALAAGGPAELIVAYSFSATSGTEAIGHDANKWPLSKVDTGFVEGEPVDAGGALSAKGAFGKGTVSGQIFKRIHACPTGLRRVQSEKCADACSRKEKFSQYWHEYRFDSHGLFGKKRGFRAYDPFCIWLNSSSKTAHSIIELNQK